MKITESEIKELVPDERDQSLIQGLTDVGAGKSMIRAITAKRDYEREMAEMKPEISDEVKKHLFYRMGMVAMANWILSLPDEIKKRQK